jgi:hypothetical protein
VDFVTSSFAHYGIWLNRSKNRSKCGVAEMAKIPYGLRRSDVFMSSDAVRVLQ